MARKFLFSVASKLAAYEQRVGVFQVPCTSCGQPAPQLLFRLYQLRGHNVVFQPEENERFQVRCGACGAARHAMHPSQWVPQLGMSFRYEQHPATPASPAYAALVYGPPRA